VIVEHTRLVVAFGGMPYKNSAVAPGGVTRHVAAGHLHRARERGCEFVLFSPVADDLDGATDWRPLRPGTDTAVMLALAHTLVSEGLADREFLDRYCAGSDRFLAYLQGDPDGQPKTAEWAAAISGIDAAGLRALARRMAATRTLVTTSWSLQRADHGKQPVWAMIALAALLGQIGLPGGGFGHGYGAEADIGVPPVDLPRLGLPGRPNPVRDFIPVARISDLLLHPGEEFDYDGRRLVYPDIRLVYWCGGNPFHHHQDLNRLRRAFSRPDTVVVHDPFWTATARHADVVLPATTTLEREDIAAGPNDPFLVAMHRMTAPVGDARDDYDIFAGLADRFGCRETFTEGRSARAWLMHLYEQWCSAVEASIPSQRLPAFEEFWTRGYLRLPVTLRPQVLLAAFRADPDGHPLRTPSGKIELYSEEIAGFDYDDCPGHPAWLPPAEWLGSPKAQRFPLHLVANQPSTRLHSQLDMGAYSQAAKIRGREPMRIHPTDAAARGLTAGDIARLYNDRGACLVGVVISDRVRPGVVQLSTGAWFDPEEPAAPGSMCVHGNPNVLTLDKGTSRLAQGSVGQHALVEVERFDGPLPPAKVLDPPPVEVRRSRPRPGVPRPAG
jgi:biotin/methionine sulfoxide reductase